MASSPDRLSSSFRDPAGYIFNDRGTIYRQVTPAGKIDYDSLMSSGAYKALVDQKLLVEHIEVPTKTAYKLLKPESIEFISYPYEWSFTQLKDAALVTLAAQKVALDHDLTMKDASAYNVQFLHSQPILIDTLSFEPYSGQRVWQAYRQFCQHFLAPLAIMAKIDVRLNILLRDFIDGIPLDLATTLLPTGKRLRGGLFLHLTMHSAAGGKQRTQRAANIQQSESGNQSNNKRALYGLVDSLERSITRLKLPAKLATEWGDYYNDTNYSDRAFMAKQDLVAKLIKQTKATTVWDLGGNDGTFSKVALEAGASPVICFDIDPLAVDKSYRMVKREHLTKLLPLRSDLTNPTPGLGWANQERDSLVSRRPQANTLLALALIHHLAIGNNVPFELIASFFASLGQNLIIEFIPKTDSKVKLLLSTRQDIFSDYDQTSFEQAFAKHFRIVSQTKVQGSERTIYLMQRS